MEKGTLITGTRAELREKLGELGAANLPDDDD